MPKGGKFEWGKSGKLRLDHKNRADWLPSSLVVCRLLESSGVEGAASALHFVAPPRHFKIPLLETPFKPLS